MPQNLAADVPAALANLGGFLLSPFAIDADSRLYWINFVVFIIAGAAVFWLRERRACAGRSALAYIFPKRAWLSQSSLVDFKVYVANHFFSVKAAGIGLVSASFIASVVAGAVSPYIGGLIAGGGELWSLALCTLMVALANDLGTYITHRICHEQKALWPFHQLHHSAEVLTPLTVYRKHPIYDLLSSIIQPLIMGPVIGVLVALFNHDGLWTIMGFNAVYMIFNFLGSNLRHSHIWIGFGPVLSRIFISPAMHQIHHSIDPKHYDRNYGEVFALWDCMFGTLYIPKGREVITFGVTGGAGAGAVSLHPTLKEAYLQPVREFAEIVRRKNPAAERA
jgi:sterol desaturase/sphingolipid hydroxylase (fatty acid hydroxylase superfamily)